MTHMHDKEAPVSQRPARIIRIPQAPPVGPVESHTAPSTPPRGPIVCRICGAQVIDRDKHTQFHADIAKVTRWMQRVNEILGDKDSQPREVVPTAEETTPTDGEYQIGDADD